MRRHAAQAAGPAEWELGGGGSWQDAVLGVVVRYVLHGLSQVPVVGELELRSVRPPPRIRGLDRAGGTRAPKCRLAGAGASHPCHLGLEFRFNAEHEYGYMRLRITVSIEHESEVLYCKLNLRLPKVLQYQTGTNLILTVFCPSILIHTCCALQQRARWWFSRASR